MHIVSMASLELSSLARTELTYNQYNDVKDWMSHWTLPANVQGVVAESLDSGIEDLRDQLAKLVQSSPHQKYLEPRHLQFEVYYQTCKDGRFWTASRAQLMRTFSGAA